MLVCLCFSGGRTSAYMVEYTLRLKKQGYFKNYEFIIVFTNTSKEHEETLIFVDKCDRRWRELYQNQVVWLEAVVHEGRVPSSHVITDFHSAKRNGEIFTSVVAEYGLPNNNFLHCTRELKENPIMSYMESLGERKGHQRNHKHVRATYETWIGIREDEPKRLTGNRDGKQFKRYPLAEEIDGVDLSCDKQDVLEFWSEMPFDLELPEHLGNCVDCHKKSHSKLKKVYNDMGESAFHHSAYMDHMYSTVKAQEVDGVIVERRRFRDYRNTKLLIESFKMGEPEDTSHKPTGCETSCHPFMSETED